MPVAGRNRANAIALVRWFVGDRLGVVLPMYLLRDDEVIELFIPAGTAIKGLLAADGSPIPRNTPYTERHAMPQVLGDRQWHTNDMMLIARPGEPYSVWLLWDAITGEFRHWYINLQDPMTRTPQGWDTSDHVLDIVIRPDHSWTWKDARELADSVTVGRYTLDEAARIRETGERLLRELVVPWAWPLDAGYERRRPGLPPIREIPPGWEAGLDAEGRFRVGECA